MPKGVYKRNVGSREHVGGGKPTCSCGNCRKCKHREVVKSSYYKIPITDRYRINEVDDLELEKKLVEKFKSKGWD